MPCYDYRCVRCGQHVQIIRPIDRSHIGPDAHDIPDPVDVGVVICEHDWQREHTVPMVKKGAGWGGGKGHW